MRGFRVRTSVAALGLWCLLGATAHAVVCDKPPDQNPFLKFGCSPLSQTCTITGGSAPAGCELDFGPRKVIFQGTFDVGNTVLIVRAGQIEVRGSLKARSDSNQRGGTIRLTALDSIVVTGTLDTSGNSAGLMRLQAGTSIDLTSSGLLRARGIENSSSGNSASGGSIELVTGTTFTHRGSIDLSGGVQGGGGSLLTSIGTNLLIAQSIDATGGASDGGDVDLLAGDDVVIERNINVSSTSGGGGGDIRVRAGVDRAGGVKVGGNLTVTGDLTSNGNNDVDGGYDGGEISLSGLGTVTISGALRAIAGNPDGGGGSVIVDSSDNVIGRVTELDGDLDLTSLIDVHGPRTASADFSGSGGDIDIFVGRDGRITGTHDLSGSDGGGTLNATAGRNLVFDATVDASGTATFASGGSATIRSGVALLGSLTVQRTLDVSADTNGLNGDASFAACTLNMAPGLTVDASSGSANGNPRIDLIAKHAMTIGAGGVYRATPIGSVRLVHPGAVTPQVGTNVSFLPQRTDVDSPALYPGCPVCGDGVTQPGEVCDNGPGGQGNCCNADCSAFTCPTLTPTPTVTATATGPTRSPTPTRTRTPTPTRTPVGTTTATPTPQPTITALPLIEPKAVLGCERALGKATATLTLAALKALESCALETFKCVHTRPEGSPEQAACFATTSRRCNAKLTKLDASHARFRARFIGACAGDPPALPFEVMRSTDLLGFALLEPHCFGFDLTSPEDVLGCLQVLTPCQTQRALGVGIPRLTDLLLQVADVSEHGDCLASPLGDASGLAGSPYAVQAIRCQRAIATGGRKLVTRQLSVTRSCVDGLLKCRLSGKSREACEKVGATCGRRLAALDDPSNGARAKMLAAIHKACTTLPPDVLLETSGLGFASAAERCEALGAPAPVDGASVGTCAARAYACAGTSIVRQALPLVDRELARVGLELGNDVFCALPTPTATATPVATATSTPTPSTTPTPTVTGTDVPVLTPTPTESPTPAPPTPTADVPTATPTAAEPPTPTPSGTPGCGNGVVDAGEQCDYGDDVPGDGCDALCRFERLIPGGGASSAVDCIAEWAIVNPLNNPQPGSGTIPDFRQSCVDGDPSCDANDDPDVCGFRVAVCFQNVDLDVPTCTSPPGIAKYVLVSPRPNSSDDADSLNAATLIASFGRLSAVEPTGNSLNTLVFDPPLALLPPDNCTEPITLNVERRGLPARSEKFRANTDSVPPSGSSRGVEDSDTLILNCLAPTPTPTSTP